MADWTVSQQGTTSYVDSQIGQREGSRNSNFGFGGNVWDINNTGLFGGLDVVGINVDKIPSMREAIRTYVKGITDHLDKIDATANSDSAFKSESVKAAVRAYVEKVKEYSMNLVSQLLSFSDKLQDVSDSWAASTNTLGDNINTTASAFGVGSRYTEQK